MKRFYVEYCPNPNKKKTKYIYLYANNEKQIYSIMDDYRIVAVDQTD